MEKYRQFADGGTGVNPFVPVWSNHKTSLAVRALKFLIMFPVALLRLALFAAALLWIFLAEAICALIPVGVLRYPVYGILAPIGCRVALLSLGVLPVGDALADHRRLKILPPKSGGAQVFQASRGTLVFANQQGITDVLFLGLRLCPSFVFVASDGSPVTHGLLGALRRASSTQLPPAAAAGATATLAVIAQDAQSGWRGPVVVFAEGANTNGSCVLAWKAKTFEGVATLEKPVGAAVVSLQYSKTGAYTPHHTVGTAFRHLFWLCFQPYHTVDALWLPPNEAVAAIRGKPPAEQWAFLRTLLVRMLKGAVEVDVPAERHGEFATYWDAAQRKGYTRQQQPPAGTKKKA